MLHAACGRRRTCRHRRRVVTGRSIRRGGVHVDVIDGRRVAIIGSEAVSIEGLREGEGFAGRGRGQRVKQVGRRLATRRRRKHTDAARAFPLRRSRRTL